MNLSPGKPPATGLTPDDGIGGFSFIPSRSTPVVMMDLRWESEK